MTFKNSTTHIAEDALELYSLQRVSEDALPEIEEHLLICHMCQDRLEETDRFIEAMKEATSVTKLKPSLWQQLLDSFRGFSQPVVGLSLAAALAVLFVVRTPTTQVQTVDLSATRGSDDAQVAADRSLRLQLNAQGLPASVPYYVQLVDESGKQVWGGMLNTQNAQLVVALTDPLKAGHYWARVYSDAARANLLREYGLLSK